jgi:DNA-binding HxlR family transcriptional regulator
MHRTDFAEMECSIARTHALTGEAWTPLVIRDLYMGRGRFDELQRGLGISRKVLTERLGRLVEAGLVERRQYSERPPRWEYALTTMGREFVDVLMAMVAWGDRWTAGDAGPPVLYRHRACGQVASVDPRCSVCGEPMHAGDVDVEPGPGYSGA